MKAWQGWFQNGALGSSIDFFSKLNVGEMFKCVLNFRIFPKPYKIPKMFLCVFLDRI